MPNSYHYVSALQIALNWREFPQNVSERRVLSQPNDLRLSVIDKTIIYYYYLFIGILMKLGNCIYQV